MADFLAEAINVLGSIGGEVLGAVGGIAGTAFDIAGAIANPAMFVGKKLLEFGLSPEGAAAIGSLLQQGQQNEAVNEAARQLGVSNEQALQIITDASTRASQEIKSGLASAEQPMQPFLQQGLEALSQLSNLAGETTLGPTETSPIFQRGQQLLTQALAATGQTQSPSAVSQYSAPLIAEEFTRQQNRKLADFNARLSAILPQLNLASGAASTVSGLRFGAAGQLAGVQTGTARSAADLILEAGNIGAAQRIGTTPSLVTPIIQGISALSSIFSPQGTQQVPGIPKVPTTPKIAAPPRKQVNSQIFT